MSRKKYAGDALYKGQGLYGLMGCHNGGIPIFRVTVGNRVIPGGGGYGKFPGITPIRLNAERPVDPLAGGLDGIVGLGDFKLPGDILIRKPGLSLGFFRMFPGEIIIAVIVGFLGQLGQPDALTVVVVVKQVPG